MPDALAITRVFDELLWMMRREGFSIATSQVIDCLRAVRLVGLSDRDAVREAIAAVVVQRASDRAQFDHAFDEFFADGLKAGSAGSHGSRGVDVWERLAAKGFTEVELAELRTLLRSLGAASSDGQALVALSSGGAELDYLLQLADVRRTLGGMQSSLQAGFYVHRVLARVGTSDAKRALAVVRHRLRDAFGERGDHLADALALELDAAANVITARVRELASRRSREPDAADSASSGDADRRILTTPFAALSEIEIVEVRRAVRAFAEKLRGGERVRARRARRGRLDPHATLRRALKTSGVPIAPVRRSRHRDRPRLLLLCDVSDSVRTASTFMLEVVAVAHELFERTRSFLFVSEIAETAQLFHELSMDAALARVHGGAAGVPVTHNSNYGRVLRTFEQRHLDFVDRRTTVVILGDGRTNYHEHGAEVLGRLRARARALVWLCPESRSAWATGDSAMLRYASECTHVLEVRTARELEDAARLLARLR